MPQPLACRMCPLRGCIPTMQGMGNLLFLPIETFLWNVQKVSIVYVFPFIGQGFEGGEQ